MTMKWKTLISALLIFNFVVVSGAEAKGNKMKKAVSPLNYADNSNWVAKPAKVDKAVDVFYVHPTIYNGKSPLNMDVSDTRLRNLAQGLAVSQGGVYSESANLFAPYYRQVSMAVLNDSKTGEKVDMFTNEHFLLGAGDVEAAFDYFLKHLNKDRPFIIAGHSQGTMVLIHLVRKRFHDEKLRKHLVAAYLIGYSVTQEDLKKYPWMKRAQKADDTGVIITFNTESAGSQGSPVYEKGAFAINPLNWKNDSTPAGRDQHLGAVFFDAETKERIEEIKNFSEAYVDTAKGVLIVRNMKEPESSRLNLSDIGSFPKGVYHKYDYSFWFNNLKENVKNRINAYQRQQSK
jgi:hypothetical protein